LFELSSNQSFYYYSDAFREMLSSIKTPYDECIQILLKNMKLDPYFEEFYYWAKDNNVPIVILSSGMHPIISALLEKFLGHKPANHLTIIANEPVSRDGKDINSEGGWQIKYHDDRYVPADLYIIRPTSLTLYQPLRP
jgi:2-hydroxy-3-keto-5-methylthiopentenyl-1-phosphate phosphatase